MGTKKTHFIGIGGIGMSGLASMLLEEGEGVSGSDLKASAVTKSLQQQGASIFIGHSTMNLAPDVTHVVYSTAVPPQNPELVEAQKRNLPLMHRSELLARFTKCQRSLLVAGTHGKTTTSSLLAHVLVSAGLDPSYSIGGIVTSLCRNGKKGSGEYLVAEADESDGSFLRLSAQGAIVTNIEEDHMDYWKSSECLISGFSQFMDGVKAQELLFWCHEDLCLQALKPKGTSYGFSSEAGLYIAQCAQLGWKLLFTLSLDGKIYKDIALPLIGAYNALNAAAVFGLSVRMGIPERTIREAFSTFKGISRRVERKGEYCGVPIFDDYGHHPTEILATLRALKWAHQEGRLVVAFQPHRYSRTQECFETYPGAFSPADHVILTDIYSAGETPPDPFSEGCFVTHMKNACLPPLEHITRKQLANHLASILKKGDILVTMGAGDITHVGPELMEEQ